MLHDKTQSQKKEKRHKRTPLNFRVKIISNRMSNVNYFFWIKTLFAKSEELEWTELTRN